MKNKNKYFEIFFFFAILIMMGFLNSVGIAKAINVSTPYAWVVSSDTDTVRRINLTDGTSETYNTGSYPFGVAVDVSGNAWIANFFGNTVTKLSNEGELLGTYEVGEMPAGIAIDASGNAWITNNTAGTVTKLSNAGELLGTYETGGESPAGIAIDSSGNIWIANLNGMTLTKLNNSGELVETYATGDGPYGVAIDDSGNVWITILGDDNVMKLNNSGELLGTYATGGLPVGVAIDAQNNVWIANNTDGTITKLSNSGELLGTYDLIDNSPGPIAIGEAGNVFAITDEEIMMSLYCGSGDLGTSYATGPNPGSLGDFTGFALQRFVLGYTIPDLAISSFSPADEETDVEIDSDLTIHFNKPVLANEGNIEIRNSDDSLYDTVDITSGQIQGNGTDTITIVANNDFEVNGNYYITFPDGTFTDFYGNNLTGIDDDSTWNFTTAIVIDEDEDVPVEDNDATEISDTPQKANITSWKAYRYTDEDKSCSDRLKLTIKGKHFDEDAEVKIGGFKASSVNRKSSKEITAKFCFSELLADKKVFKRSVKVINPDAEEEKADKEINLTKVSYDFEKDSWNFQGLSGILNIQKALVLLGYLDSQYITGFYGPITTEAVRKFQEQNELPQTGYFGPLTEAKLK